MVIIPTTGIKVISITPSSLISGIKSVAGKINCFLFQREHVDDTISLTVLNLFWKTGLFEIISFHCLYID